MSFLTPLYLLGALAVGLPILFHLIRRTPRGRQLFSSLMFLEPSPPRVTRRSRIEDWLLLCLRALAICLLAAAFARPFLRQPSAAEFSEAEGRWFAVLLDTSASMRRDGAWDEAKRQLTEFLDAATPGDHIAVYTFDAAPQLRFGWEVWIELEPGERAAAAQAALTDITPGWLETNLGSALIVAADSLEDAAGQDAAPTFREVVVISDLQSGSRLEALQGYTWPEEVSVRVVRIGADLPPTNAAVHPVAATDGDGNLLRVRVSNAADSERETFRLEWLDEFAGSDAAAVESDGPSQASSANTGLDVYVVPGQSRVVRAPDQPSQSGTSRLVLRGDDQGFDNICYIAGGVVRDVTIAVLSSDDPADPSLQRFYVEPMFPSTAVRDVHVVDWEFESTQLPPSEHGIQLVLLLEAPRLDQIAALRAYLQNGGLVWHVMSATEEHAATLFALADLPAASAREADLSDYAMLTDVDYTHPVFAPFADPRFSDFRSLRFWKHRSIDAGALPDAHILARFDDGDPAIGELQIGEGRLIFLASSWRRDDSQLALWTKFVPLANALLEYGSGPIQSSAQYFAGDAIRLAELTSRPSDFTQLRRPDGRVDAVPEDQGLRVTEPGPHALLTAANDPDRTVHLAVNLAPSESRTDPLSTDALEAAGIRLAASSSPAVEQANADRERQLQNRELEQQQKLWRWLLVAAVAVLVVETLLAGRLAGLRRFRPAEPER